MEHVEPVELVEKRQYSVKLFGFLQYKTLKTNHGKSKMVDHVEPLKLVQ